MAGIVVVILYFLAVVAFGVSMFSFSSLFHHQSIRPGALRLKKLLYRGTCGHIGTGLVMPGLFDFTKTRLTESVNRSA